MDKDRSISESAKNLSKNIEKFSTDYWKCLDEKDGNFVCSPLSCHFVLSMCAAGAKENTAQEMYKALYLENDTDFSSYRDLTTYFNKSYVCQLANKIYVDESIVVKDNFVQLTEDNFDSKIQKVDFFSKKHEAVKIINNWCSEKTEGKITDILSGKDIETTTKLILVNAIYFNDFWKVKFASILTTPKPFYISETKFIKVPTMKLGYPDYYFYKNLTNIDAECISIPFRHPDFALIIIRPKEIDGLQKIENNIDKINIDYNNEMKNSKNHQYINLELPRFKIECFFQLNEPLQKLGMEVMFTNNANFEGISEEPKLFPPLKVKKVVQKVVIDVKETGTEAAAVTYVRQVGGGPPIKRPKVNDFFVDRPFFFCLVNSKYNLTLFSGRVMNPGTE